MNALVRKEFRLILPAWTVALVASAAGPVVLGTGHPVSVFAFWLGMAALGLAPFGREFSSGSFSSLLTQPVPRVRLWRAKIGCFIAVALSLICLSLFLWANQFHVNGKLDWTLVWVMASTGLAVLSGGLWTTLLFRQITAAFWITLLVPAALALGVSLIIKWLTLRLAYVLPAATLRPDHAIPVAISAVLLPYSIAGYWWARRLFLRAQDVGWGVVEAPLPSFAGWFNAHLRGVGGSCRQPLRALVAKEFQLHSLSLFFAAGILALHLAAIGVRKFGSETGGWREAAYLMWALWFILPFIVGAEAVASERQLGTVEGQLCLPARRRTQFAVKLLFALTAGVSLGGFMPWLVENCASLFDVGSEVLTKSYTSYSVREHSSIPVLFGWAAAAAGLALLSFYASTLTRSTLQALGGAVVGWIVVWMLILFGARPEVLCKVQLWRGWLFHWIGGVTLIPVVMGLSYWNFKRLHQAGQLWRRNLAVLIVWLVFTVAATSAVYYRTWELVTPLEPQHGPARIVGTKPAKFCQAIVRTFILLPDGRLWAAKDLTVKSIAWNRGQFMPASGMFVSGSNWVDVVSALQFPASVRVVGLQADGSLWEILREPAQFSAPFRADQPPAISLQRIGPDSDWKALAAGAGYFLAVKQEGSLWGWGENGSGQLGEGPNRFTNGPVRIGKDSDWVAVFASQVTSAGVKRDGSLWKWGRLDRLPDGKWLRKETTFTSPIRWSLPATNLASFQSNADCDLALYADGSAKAVGFVPRGWLSDADRSELDGTGPVWHALPVQCGRAGEWSEIVPGEFLLAIKRDRSLWKQRVEPWKRGKQTPLVKASDHSDWIGVSSLGGNWPLTALAADGTLCCWASVPFSHPGDLLAPTRRPLWTLNIFDVTK